MGRSLYRDEPLFRVIVDQCADILAAWLGRDLREVLYPSDLRSDEAAARLRQTEFTQCALFVVEYALASLWMSWGVKPALMVGHSVGEFVCAVLSGVMSLDDALRLVASRGKLLQALPPGTMVSVRLPAAKLEARLPPALSVASTNGPSLSVVAGPTPDVDAFTRELDAEGVLWKALHTSHAFHSPMMVPAILPFEAVVRSATLSPPRLPFVSSFTGNHNTEREAKDPRYWAEHLRKKFRFSEAITLVCADRSRVLLEVGPRTTLATLSRQHMADKTLQLAVSSMSDGTENEAEWQAMLTAVGRLWQGGVARTSPSRTTTRPSMGII
jgi:acyl transferase domain-containing protein